MAKSKLQENHTLKAEGILDIENLTLDIEEIGTKDLKEILAKFDGQSIKISIGLNTEIFE